MATRKHELGQFMTTNWERILVGMSIPVGVGTIIEPFCGQGICFRWCRLV